jgi:hypothetical protein
LVNDIVGEGVHVRLATWHLCIFLSLCGTAMRAEYGIRVFPVASQPAAHRQILRPYLQGYRILMGQHEPRQLG